MVGIFYILDWVTYHEGIGSCFIERGRRGYSMSHFSPFSLQDFVLRMVDKRMNQYGLQKTSALEKERNCNHLDNQRLTK